MDGLLLVGVIILNIVGIIWLGKLIDHAILLPIGYLILISVLLSNSHDEIVGGVFIGVAVVTVSAIVGKAISAMRDTREEKENARLEAKKEAEKSRRNDDLLNAVNRGDKQKVQELLKTDVDVDYMGYISPRYKTLLEIAVENNDKEMVTLLIEKGANVNLDNDGKCPLDYANNEEIIALLRSHGAKTKEEIEEELKEEQARKEEEKRAEEERKRLEAEEVLIKGCAYFNGDGVIQDYAKAVEFFEKAVELGNIRAYFYLALCYVEGKYVEKDVNKAIQLLMVSAEAGYMDAQLILGNLLYMKESSDEISERVYNVLMQNDASSWWRKAAEQGSDTAMYNLGSYYLELDILEDAGKWFEKAAANGNQKAFEKLKDLCSRGLYYVE